MKTTIDIPDPLYRKVKIRAIEQKKTLKEVVLHALQRELEPPGPGEAEPPKTFRERRKLLPSFRKAAKAGAFRPPPGARDITELISEDRDVR